MGGTVSLSVAIQFPQRVSKVVVVGSPIVGSSLNLLLKLFGRRPIAYVLFNNMWVFRTFYHLLSPLYSRDKRWAEMMDRDVSKLTLESFFLSIASLGKTDLRPFLDQVKIPAMGMYGDRDVVVHPAQWKVMLEGIPHTRVERFHTAGHFIMLDEPQQFMDTLRNFLDGEVHTP
jgi:pimeloyl-ACP methyl ester carboxylesterase